MFRAFGPVLAASFALAAAPAAQLSIQLSDPSGKPISGAQITLTAPSSIALTDVAGKASIEYQAASGPLAFKIIRPSGLVIVSPWQGSTSVPPNVQTLIAATHAQVAALQSPAVVKAAVAKVNNLQRPVSATGLQEANAPPKYYLDRAAKEMGVDPDRLEAVLRRLRTESPEPYERGMANLYQRDYQQAAQDLAAALLKAEQQVPPNPREISNAAAFLGQTYFNQGRYTLASNAYLRAIQARPDDPALLNNLGNSLSRAGLYRQARPVYQRAIDILAKQPDRDPLELQIANSNLAALYVYAGDYAGAEPILRRVLNINESLSPRDPNVAGALNNLAAILLAQQKCAEARPLLERAVQIQRETSTHNSAAAPSKDIAVLDSQFRNPPSLMQSRSLTFQRSGIGPGTPGLNSTMVNLASLLVCEGKGAQARDVLDATIERETVELAPGHPDLATPLNILAQAQLQLGDSPAAEQNLRRALQIQVAALTPEHPVLALTRINLAALLARDGRAAEAQTLYHQAENSLVKAFGDPSPPVQQVRDALSKLNGR
uniref:Tetratricopeptide TPR_2 repeat protein n=1 Tax=Solibacter usitatus (strain Ellin6076) TaxID=234267 RepID=Q01P12_SOLUE